jgi:hypothetical protein
MYRTPDEIQQELTDIERRRLRLAEELASARAEDPLILLADAIHSKICHSNHTDGCGYEYEGRNGFFNKSGSKAQYYQQAQNLVQKSGVNAEVCLKVIKNM